MSTEETGADAGLPGRGLPDGGLPAHVRDAIPRVRAALIRRHGQLDLADDALGEALVDAAAQWPVQGVPDEPQAWLLTVASRRLIDQVRSESARRDREERDGRARPVHELLVSAPGDDDAPPSADDTLHMLVLCCHPDLPAASQIALALRAVGGLTTAEIARALLVPEATAAQRISRAKSTLRRSDRPFTTLAGAAADEAVARLAAVHHVLYLIFTEGHTATSGADLVRTELTERALTLAREVHEARPGAGDSAGLLALMLLTEARTPARRDADGRLVPLAEQDRTAWDAGRIREGLALTGEALRDRPVGSYALQAAIAAVHAEAPSAAETDWAQIVALYRLLRHVADSVVVRLNLAVALAMTEGPAAGLAALPEPGPVEHHRVHAVRGHLLAMSGDEAAAHAAWVQAAELATSPVESAYLDGLRRG